MNTPPIMYLVGVLVAAFTLSRILGQFPAEIPRIALVAIVGAAVVGGMNFAGFLLTLRRYRSLW